MSTIENNTITYTVPRGTHVYVAPFTRDRLSPEAMAAALRGRADHPAVQALVQLAEDLAAEAQAASQAESARAAGTGDFNAGGANYLADFLSRAIALVVPEQAEDNRG